nr:hypothetical protein [synthetic human alphaherpesvirus 1]
MQMGYMEGTHPVTQDIGVSFWVSLKLARAPPLRDVDKKPARVV